MPNNRPKKQPDYLSRSIQMAVVIFGCAMAGIYADSKLDWKFPLFTVVLSLLGVALGIYIFVRDSN